MRLALRLRCVGEGVTGREERIAEAVAAAAQRRRLALLQGVKTAGYDRGGHILAAIFIG